MSNEKNPGSVWAQAFVWQLLSLGGGPWCELCHGITYGTRLLPRIGDFLEIFEVYLLPVLLQ